MPVNLTIDDVPDEVAELLNERARRSGRTLQDELMAILTDSVLGRAPLSLSEALAEVRALGLKSAGDSVRILRERRDAE